VLNRNKYGRLGDGTTSDKSIPTAVAGGGSWMQISAGRLHTCGIKVDGSAWCWGSNQNGALGDGRGDDYESLDSTTYSTTPQLVSGGLSWLQIDAGPYESYLTCGIASDNSGFCWGGNRVGQVGDGTSGNWRTEPTAIDAPGVTWSEISTGWGFACGITTEGVAQCWGYNEYTKLGSEGSNANTPRKVAIEGPWGPSVKSTTPSNAPTDPSAITPPPPPPTNNSSGASTGAIVGGVVGGLAVIAAVTAGLIFYRRRKIAEDSKSTSATTTEKADSENAWPATRPEDSIASSSIAISSLSTMQTSADPVLQWIQIQSHQNSGASLRSSSSRSSIPDHLKAVEFAWQDARVLKPLGVGSFGKVFLAELHHSPVALKLLLDAKALTEATKSPGTMGLNGNSMMSSGAPSMASTNALVKEVSVMAPLRHPNVALMVGYCMNPPCVALEYASRGSLFDVLQKGNTDSVMTAELTWQRRLAMAADAAAGMLHLHTRDPPILHRDLKSPNLLVSGDWTVKVADMGLSKLVDEATQGSTATTGGASNPRWLAPEVLSGDNSTAASDVFSFGVVMWELLTWKLPWSDLATMWNIVGNVQRGGRPTLSPESELPGLRPNDSIDAYIGLMQRCWAQDPAARPDFNTVAAELRSFTMQCS